MINTDKIVRSKVTNGYDLGYKQAKKEGYWDFWGGIVLGIFGIWFGQTLFKLIQVTS